MGLTPVTNFGKVTVSTGYTSTGSTIILNTGHGAKLPSTFPFPLIWWDSTTYTDPTDDPNVEVVSVTNRVTDTLTVTRAQEGTSASNKNTAGKTYLMSLGLTAAMYNALVSRSESWLTPNLLDNAALAVSVSASAITIALKTLAGSDPSSTDVVRAGFNNNSLTSGVPVIRSVSSALSLTISNGSSLGMTALVRGRVYVGLFDNAGSVVLGAWNPLNGTGIFGFSENDLISTTAEGGAGGADNAAVIYTSSALTSVRGRYLGYFEITPAAAFAWTNAPVNIVLLGPDSPRSGSLLRRERSAVNNFASGGTAWAATNAQPTSSYGDQYMVVATTVYSTMNVIRLTAQGTWCCSANVHGAIGFLGVGATAILGIAGYTNPQASVDMTTIFQEYVIPGSTSTGWAVRAGGSAGTWYLNGNGAALYTSQFGSFLQVEEIML